MTEDTNTVGSRMDKTLTERGSRYGPWRLQSQVTQQIKRAMADTPNWDRLPDYLREAFDQIANKMARVLSGDWMYDDNVHDMVGYARLAEECLLQDIKDGVEHPFIVDPNNPPVDWLRETLTEMGYTVTPPVVEDRTEEVAKPAFLSDPIRASGSQFTSEPPRTTSVAHVFNRLDKNLTRWSSAAQEARKSK